MKVPKSKSIIKIVTVLSLAGLAFNALGQSFYIYKPSILYSELELKMPMHNFDTYCNTLSIKFKNNQLSNSYSEHAMKSLGLFCKAEQKIQSSSNIPFRFRLGSVDYVNWLESKPNASSYLNQH